MKRREFLKVAAGTTASTAIVGCTGRKDAGRPANVVFLFADELRGDALGPYGSTNLSTPHIDRMASEGLTFDNALSTCPLCSPYRGMLLTGRYPTHSGILLNRIEASPEQNPDCLAQLFGRAGYDTGFIGKWHLSAGPKKYAARFEGNRAGMLEFLEENPDLEFTPPGPDRLGFRHWEAYNYHADFNDYWFYRDEPRKIRVAGYETEIQIDQAIAYMDERLKRDEPFALFIAPHPPHPPFEPEQCPPGYLEMIRAELDWPPNMPAEFDVAAQTRIARCYYAMIRNLDDCVGRLLDYLDESGLSQNTLTVFTSDHGEMLGSRGQWGKMTPYRESVEIPLVMRWPSVIPAGARTDALYTPMDHLPTLCGLAGIAAPRVAGGIDLRDVVLGGSSARRAVPMMNYVGGWVNFKSGDPKPEWRAVRTLRHTYVRWLTGHEELYDAVVDPYQLANLAGASDSQDVLAELRDALTAMLAAANDEFLPGTAYADWYGDERNLIRTALGPVPSA